MRRLLTLAQQAFGLRGRFGDANVHFSPPGLVCVLDLTPTPLSRTYSVKIEYDGFSRPVVKVLSPNLKGIQGKELPHTFKDGDLCLHLHEEWGPEDLITATIVPWASEWLLHYELWLASGGTWSGGGHEAEAEAEAA